MGKNGPVDTRVMPDVEGFFDPGTNTISYIVKDTGSNAGALFDSVLDFDDSSGHTSTASADKMIARVRQRGLEVAWLIETHVYADHLAAAPYIQRELGGELGIGARITEVQNIFGKVFNAGTEFERDGRRFDRPSADGDTYEIGGMTAFAVATPGHTQACMTHVVGDAASVGDTLFMPDDGSARADFPGGDAASRYHSMKRVLELPLETRLFMCHDDGPNGRDVRRQSTVADEHAHNIHVRDGIGEAEFVAMRTARDAELGVPKRGIPSIQVTMRAGRFPEAEDDGTRYVVERGKIVPAEFGSGGKLLPSFPSWLLDGTKPTRTAWLSKERIMPPLYRRGLLEGREWLAQPERASAAPAG